MNPVVHSVPIRSHGYENIASGSKTIEGRINKGFFRKMNNGDIIRFIHPDHPPMLAQIIGIREYHSFYRMIKKEGIENVTPDIDSLSDALKLYRKFYSIASEKLHGVLAIEIQVI
jgi:ASC-1-like (ASCH) protein